MGIVSQYFCRLIGRFGSVRIDSFSSISNRVVLSVIVFCLKNLTAVFLQNIEFSAKEMTESFQV